MYVIELHAAIVAAVALGSAEAQIVAMGATGEEGRLVIWALDGLSDDKAERVLDELADRYPLLEVEVRREPIRAALEALRAGGGS